MLHEKSLKSCDTLSENFTMDKMRGLSNRKLANSKGSEVQNDVYSRSQG